MKTILFYFLLFVGFLHADVADLNKSSTLEAKAQKQENNITQEKKLDQKSVNELKEEANNINEKLADIEQSLKKNIWYSKYNNHQIYINLENDLEDIRKKMFKLNPKKDDEKLAEFAPQEKALQNQLELLSDFNSPPFEILTKPKDIESTPKIENPFNIINGFTYLKALKKRRDHFKNDLANIKALIFKLSEKEKYARRLNTIYGGDYNINRINKLEKELDEIISTSEIATNTFKLYSKKTDDNILKVTTDIKAQMKRVLNVAIIILVISLLSFLFKYLAKKTISDNERYYMANKGINFTNFILILLVLLFSFLENVSHLITVLGFASAGLAFAMKDLFMSVLGWIVIVFGGSFHVGDRVKASKNGLVYVGDIIDISLLRMTILEDITLTTVELNKRSGRIIFIPNNYIFTELISNYTHGKIKTVWDGVEFVITYDSNYKKALHLSKEIVKKYSKGYTDISRKQLNMLRSQYSLKNINVEPRAFTFMEENGIRISCWYMTNSYATLTLRSNIFANIIDAINEADDIKIAYPTQIINIKRDVNLPPKEGDTRDEESIL